MAYYYRLIVKTPLQSILGQIEQPTVVTGHLSG